ncbi:FecR family protein [Agitococcus lubricus]|uniref:FecR family protein n=1 Tax=Agitococcus lubricus TaxID=1077255 RepID=A0A2T5J065_9GAMM|nr:FecR family protein [Agitococcus lubricus]PTQ89629.1 FecR family protein [Agitococcus lubricus]
MKRIALVSFLVLMNQSVLAQSQCRVGQVVQITGNVELQRKNETIKPIEGTQICRGDLVKTATGSIAELKLRDGSKITVGKDSQLVIKEYKIFRKQPNVALFELLQGAFRSVTGSITKRPHRYEVTTRVATIGVRGTDFWGGYGLSPDGALDVVMLEGTGVYVKNDKGQVELDKAGLGTTVSSDTPTTPKTWPEEKVMRAMATIQAN